MSLLRIVPLSIEAGSAIRQILGIMTDQLFDSEAMSPAWDVERIIGLDQVIYERWTADEWEVCRGPVHEVELEIEDVSIVLTGMAFTEVASADLPWVDMVRWTSDFVTAELRPYWTDEEWQELTGR